MNEIKIILNFPMVCVTKNKKSEKHQQEETGKLDLLFSF